MAGKIIKVIPELEVTVLDFPEGSHSAQNHALQSMIGEDCRCYEHVMPRELYEALDFVSSTPDVRDSKCVSMLIDEEGLFKNLPFNAFASYLYGTQKHGCPIVGTVLFIGEEMTPDGIDFTGIGESVFDQLHAWIEGTTAYIKEFYM